MSYYYIYNITDGETDANRFSTPEEALKYAERWHQFDTTAKLQVLYCADNNTENSKKEIVRKLQEIKSYIFKNTIAKIDYLKIQKKTGEELPFYKQIVELNEIIEKLKEEIKKDEKGGV